MQFSNDTGITSVAEGVTLTLEAIARDYRLHAALKKVPELPDHGVPKHNVMGRVSGDDLAAFHAQVCDAAEVARQALDCTEDEVGRSVERWQQLFGERFPEAAPPDDGDDRGGPGTGGFTRRTERTEISPGRFA